MLFFGQSFGKIFSIDVDKTFSLIDVSWDYFVLQ